MTLNGKKLALTAIGSALALSFVVFGILFVRYDRGRDPNNEDAILALARKAEADDNPPMAAHCWQRLIALNPFKKDYVRSYYHALVRVRDFRTLAAYTNELPVATELTADEKNVERLLVQGFMMERARSNELAVACYKVATNLNYYAATPYLIDCHARNRRFGAALDAARAYIRRFPNPTIVQRTAEWCALANRPDLIEETRKAMSAGSGYSEIVFNYYCDALVAWLKNDKAALAAALEAIGRDTIKTPVARMMALESAADGDSPTRVSIAYQNLAATPPLLDFSARSKFAVKRFVASHFPTNIPIRELGRLADMVLEDSQQDIDLLRVSLLARLESDTLSEAALARAEQLYPDDKGLKAIRKGYDRKKAASR